MEASQVELTVDRKQLHLDSSSARWDLLLIVYTSFVLTEGGNQIETPNTNQTMDTHSTTPSGSGTTTPHPPSSGSCFSSSSLYKRTMKKLQTAWRNPKTVSEMFQKRLQQTQVRFHKVLRNKEESCSSSAKIWINFIIEPSVGGAALGSGSSSVVVGTYYNMSIQHMIIHYDRTHQVIECRNRSPPELFSQWTRILELVPVFTNTANVEFRNIPPQELSTFLSFLVTMGRRPKGEEEEAQEDSANHHHNWTNCELRLRKPSNVCGWDCDDVRLAFCTFKSYGATTLEPVWIPPPQQQRRRRGLDWLEVTCRHFTKVNTIPYWNQLLIDMKPQLIRLGLFIDDVGQNNILRGLFQNEACSSTKLQNLHVQVGKDVSRNDILASYPYITKLHSLKGFQFESKDYNFLTNHLEQDNDNNNTISLLDTVWNHSSIERFCYVGCPIKKSTRLVAASLISYLQQDRTNTTISLQHLELILPHKEDIQQLIQTLTIRLGSMGIVDDYDPKDYWSIYHKDTMEEANRLLRLCRIQRALLHTIPTKTGLYPYLLAKFNQDKHRSKLFTTLVSYANMLR